MSYRDLLAEAQARKNAELIAQRLGEALYAAYVELGEDTDGAQSWQELFLPITRPSWADVMVHAIRARFEDEGD